MRILAHIWLRAVEGFLIDNLGQSIFCQWQRLALFRHELTLRQPTLANPTFSRHMDDPTHESSPMKNALGAAGMMKTSGSGTTPAYQLARRCQESPGGSGTGAFVT
jgi:hypothetical protein